MTVWVRGMLAVVIKGGEIECANCWHTGTEAPKVGTVARVAFLASTIIEEGHGAGKPCGCVDLVFDDGRRALAVRCRPAVDNHEPCEEEFITLLNLSKPAPAQPHEVKALVGDTGEGKLSSRPSVAVCTSTRIDAGEGTETVGASLQRHARSHTEAGSYPVDNATGSVSNRNEIVVPHGDPNT